MNNVYAGFDISLTETGFSIIYGTGEIAHSGVISTKANEPYPVRIARIADGVVDIITKHRPDLAVVEEMAMHARFNSGTIFPLHGAVIYAIHKAGLIQPARVAATTLKKFVLGKGNGDKSDIKMVTLERWGVKLSNDNICDAYACARLAGAIHGGMPVTLKFEQECVETVAKKMPRRTA